MDFYIYFSANKRYTQKFAHQKWKWSWIVHSLKTFFFHSLFLFDILSIFICKMYMYTLQFHPIWYQQHLSKAADENSVMKTTLHSTYLNFSNSFLSLNLFILSLFLFILFSLTQWKLKFCWQFLPDSSIWTYCHQYL